MRREMGREANALQEQVVREQLMTMLTWEIDVKTHFSRSAGKLGKYFQRHLEPEVWSLLLQTYADADAGRTWDALFAMCTLFRRVALSIAEHFGYDYPHGDDARVSAHLAHVLVLPKDAEVMY